MYQVEANLLPGGESLEVEVGSLFDLKPTHEAWEGDRMDGRKDILEWSCWWIQRFWRTIFYLV